MTSTKRQNLWKKLNRNSKAVVEKYQMVWHARNWNNRRERENRAGDNGREFSKQWNASKHRSKKFRKSQAGEHKQHNNTTRHIIFKQLKTKDREDLEGSQREKKAHCIPSKKDLQTRKPEKNGLRSLKWWKQSKTENLWIQNTVSTESVFQRWKRNKDFLRPTKAEIIH